MFNFKPRVYRSAEGCCICKAKSSSSRFTESIKYEEDFAKCFDLKDPRSGQICNACVLLVKRFKRLPAGSQRNWGHVVDARAGPGTKTLLKIKRNKEEKCKDAISTQSRHIGKSIISEKFSKIFKKSKKMKLHLSPSRSTQAPLIQQPNSVESDNEESSESSQDLSKTNSPTAPKIVLFQTQTRASAFRLKHKAVNKPITMTKSNDLIIKKPLAKFIGSKKRKKMQPKKLTKHPLDEHDDYKFFDENEWIRQTSCCGIFYECAKLNNAIIIDVEQFEICQHHKIKDSQQQHSTSNTVPKAKCAIKTTLPAVVKLSLPLTQLNSNNKSPPVLKKHHLFFKRQSENFPQEDSTTSTTTTNTVPFLATVKTDNSEAHTAIAMVENSTNSAELAQHSILPTENPLITTVPSAAGATTSSTLNIKSSHFLHKIRSDAGKIVKHSFEKINSAVRLKVHDLSEIKHLVKTVDKNYVLNMPTPAPNTHVPISNPSTEELTTSTTTNKFSDNSSDSGFDENVQDRKSVSPMQQENDIKTILPPRPPVQTLILASGVKVHGQTQNLVYAGNEAAAKILQSRIATQNSNALLQQNKRLEVQQDNSAVDTTKTTAASVATLKLVHSTKFGKTSVKPNPNCLVSIGAYGGVKMRALYNNNAIRHENGITTILPASSLAAANQANQISMNANVPNTITITPAAASLVASSATSSSTLPLAHSAYQQPLSNTLTHIPLNRRAI